MNVFPLRDDDSAGPSASTGFDPSRTGDRIAPPSGDLGLGSVSDGGGAGVDTPRRNPIGFAPPREVEQPGPARYRTEISFKRHQPPAPRSTTRAHLSAAPPSLADIFAAASGGSDETGKVPFYKREISFRRRKDESSEPAPRIEAPAEPVVAVEAPAQPVAEVGAPEPEYTPEEVVGGAAGDEPEADVLDANDDEPVSEPTASEPSADEVIAADADEQAPEVTTSPEPTPEPAPAAEPVAEPVPAVAAVADPPAENGRRFSRRKADRGETQGSKRGRSRSGGGKVVGLKIGASQLAAAVVVENGDRHELVQLARTPLEAGVVIDGEVRDAEALTHALKTFFDEHKLPRKNVRIGLSSNRIGVRTLDIAGVDDEARFDNAVRFKAHEVLPVAVNESVLDYRILDERPNEAGEPLRRVLLVVAPREQVEPYVEATAQAGIRLAGIDLEALALLRTFVEPRPFATRALDDTATVVVSIGHESTTLLVAGGGACEFTRVFDWGGSTLQDAIVETLDLPSVEAATVLRHLSLTGPGRQLETIDDTSRSAALDAVRQRLTPFAREFVASLQFYQTQPESLGIGAILLTGGTAHLEGLGEALHQMIGVDVRVGDPLARVHVATEISQSIEATIGSMAAPIGLAVQDGHVRGVDLLPKDARAAARNRPSLARIAAPVAIAVPLVLVGLLYASAHSDVSDRQDRLDELDAQIAALPEPVRPQIDASLQGAQAQRALAVANVLGGRVAWDRVLGDLSKVLPRNVWLTNLTARQAPPPVASVDGTTPAPAPVAQVAVLPSGVTIDGYTYSQPDVARLLARLAALRSLNSVTLQSSTKEKVGDKQVFRFTIIADLNETGGAR